MKKYSDNKFYAYVGTVISCIGIAGLILFVIRLQTERFRDTLYIYTNLLSSQKIYLQTMQRTILSVVLFSFGLGCIFLYYIAYENDIFLDCTRLFMYSSGLVISLWDYQTVFHSAQKYGWFWRVSGDACLILMSSAVLTVALKQMELNKKKPLYQCNRIVSATAVLFCISKNLYVSQIAMICFFVAYVALILYSLVILLKKKTKKVQTEKNIIYSIFDGIPLIVQVFIAYLAIFYKYETLSKWYNVYLNILGYIVLVYIVLLFTSFFQLQRTGLLLGGETNRKIIEITRHKETITELILEQCKIPVNNLILYKEKFKETNSISVFDNIFHEIDSLKRALDNIENFNYFYGQRSKGRDIKINLAALMHYTFYIMSLNGTQWSGKTDMNNISDSDYIQGDPSILIQANETFLMSVMNVCGGKRSRVSVYKSNDEQVRIKIQGEIYPEKYSIANRMQKIVTSKSRTMPIRGDEELKLWVARDYIINGKNPIQCYIKKKNKTRRLTIEYSLDIWRDEIAGEPVHYADSVHDSGDRKRIILLSSASEQIDMIRSYLEPENYKILCFNIEEDVLKYFEKDHDIGAVIIGTIFYFANLNQFLTKVREQYPMEQLPILIISDDKYRFVGNDLLSYVNDVMVEPFDQIDLSQKIHLLILLQKSAKETIRARLDFLQAQMDPHFIFNTLSTIMPLCLQDSMRCYEVLSDFSQYLRGRLYVNNFQEPVSIEKEIELIQAYLAIEKVRFADKLYYTICTEVDDSVLILPLLVEPLVENSVKHGIKGCEPLHIEINIKDGGDGYVYISVRDNGKGMSEEQLNRIIHDDTKNTGSLGIKNVRKRLIIYYNQPLEIDSAEHVGTKTSFKIPKHSVCSPGTL